MTLKELEDKMQELVIWQEQELNEGNSGAAEEIQIEMDLIGMEMDRYDYT